MNKLNTIDGETLMSRPLQPLNFVVDTLISQGSAHPRRFTESREVLAGTVVGGHSCQRRIRLGNEGETGDHTIPLPGRFPAPYPEPARRRDRGRTVQRPLLYRETPSG